MEYFKKFGVRNASLLREEAYIGGKWVPATTGKTFDVINPANGKVCGFLLSKVF